MDTKKHVVLTYAIFFISVVLMFFPITFLLGFLLLIVGYTLTVSKKEIAKAKGTPFENHFQWANRTFWIGHFYFLLLLILSGLLLFKFTALSPVIEAFQSGQPDLLLPALQTYISTEMNKFIIFSVAPLIPGVIWWFNRCWIGYKYASKSLPVENVKSWL